MYNKFVSIKPYIRKEIYDGSNSYRFSKERKREVFESLILSEMADVEDRIPAAQIVENVLKRIEIKSLSLKINRKVSMTN